MTSTVLYACDSRVNGLRKEDVVFENFETALAGLIDFERRPVPANDAGNGGRAMTSVPGLSHIKSGDSIIALGKAAHTMLADYQKRTLIASDLDLDTDTGDPSDCVGDLNRLVWSCVNTLKVVALGAGAWRSVQILPLPHRCHYDLPPLHIRPQIATASDSVLVVNHEADGERARRLTTFLRRQGVDVGEVGCSGSAPIALNDACWASDANIHIHVGRHTIASEELRVVDTWHSRRLAIQLVANKRAETKTEDDLAVEDQINGFLCDSFDRVLAIYEEIRCDQVLQRKLKDAGAQTVAPLARHWKTIARDLIT